MNKRQRQKELQPVAVTGSLYLFGKPSWEIEGLENGDLTPELIARIAAAGDEIKERLNVSAKVLTKLRALGWNGEGTLYDFNIWKETTREQAIIELSAIGIDPESVSLTEVGEGDDGFAPDGWIPIGGEFTVPKQTLKELASIPIEDLNRMKTQLDLMEKALRAERSKRRETAKRAKSAEERASKTDKKNDQLMRSVEITSTFVEELLSQRYIRLPPRDDE